MAPKDIQDIQVLMPGTWNCYLTGQRYFPALIKLKILTWGDYPELSEWILNVITSVLIRGRQGEVRHRREGDVTTLAETGVMHPQAKECRQPSEAGRCTERNHARNLQKEPALPTILAPQTQFRLVASSTVRMNFCCFKPPSLW